jgi:hypothetical protein
VIHKSNIMTTGQNALSTTAELVLAAKHSRISVAIHNVSTDIAVYVGYDSGVTSSNGHKIHFLSTFEMQGYNGPVYMISASGTPTVTFVEW